MSDIIDFNEFKNKIKADGEVSTLVRSATYYYNLMTYKMITFESLVSTVESSIEMAGMDPSKFVITKSSYARFAKLELPVPDDNFVSFEIGDSFSMEDSDDLLINRVTRDDLYGETSVLDGYDFSKDHKLTYDGAEESEVPPMVHDGLTFCYWDESGEGCLGWVESVVVAVAEELEFEVAVFRLDNYKMGNRMWKAYDFQTKTWVKTQKDYVSPKMVISSYKKARPEEK